jgi:hypothetical protein
MADPKRALVLHLSHGGEPLVFALSTKSAEVLEARLSKLVAAGQVDSVELSDGSAVSVNFSHVATAHLDELPPLARVYGSGRAQSGFSS